MRTKRFGEYFDQQLAQLEREAGSSGSAGFSRASAGPGGMASSELPGVPSAATSPAALRHRERPSLSGNFGDEPDDYEDDDGPPPMPGLATFRGGKPPQQQQKGAEVTPGGSPATSRPGTPAGAAAGAKMSRRARKAQQQAYGGAPMSSGDESSSAAVAAAARRKGASTKKGRKWDADGMAVEDDGDIVLDYSTVASDAGGVDGSGMAVRATGVEHVDESTWGRRAQGGKFVLNDLDDEVASILARGEEARKQKEAERASKGVLASVASGGGLVGSGVSAISGLFRNVVGGKTLTKEDLEKAMKGMEEHLLRKNVAREAAVRLCEGVEQELLGVRTGSFESISTRVRAAMEASLTKMLTPTSSLDLLREIDAIAKPPPTSLRKPRPYVMSIVGVNGVGKSTNLSKICFFLLQNGYRVLVAAADTFRSGAVEQLATHVRNLSELAAREASGRAHVELYQRGYGKDAATVAKDAVAFAAAEAFDVVLIDTAGRRHNDQRLMSSLEKFAKLAQPDKILMVGEVSCRSLAAAISAVSDRFHRPLSAPTP